MDFTGLLIAGVLGWIAWDFARNRYGKGARKTPAVGPIRGGPDEVVFVDLETTGLSADKHEIIEIGAILATREQMESTSSKFTTFQTLVRPAAKLPPRITEITGITQQMLEADGVPIEQALADLAEFIADRHLVAYNAKFDSAFLKAATARAGRPAMQNDWTCALELARAAWPGLKSYKLETLARSVDSGQAHRALADCHRALIVYAAARQQLRR